MSSLRHHIAILFDPCTLDAESQTVHLKKASYELQYQRSFLSIILECISEYMRIIFDLHPSFITFDIISCGNKIHSQTSIAKSDYIRSIERFSSIQGIKSSDETKFVEAIEQFLLELPSDFYNSHQYSSPFESHQFPPITHILFIARNQENIANYKYLINESNNAQINFTQLCKTARIRNDSIKNVYILKYDGLTMDTHCEWTKTTKAAYYSKKQMEIDRNKRNKEEGEYLDDEDKNDADVIIDYDGDKSEIINFFEGITTIHKLHDTLLQLISDIQFPQKIRTINIVSVPFKDPQTQVKTSLTIPMVCCIDNINHKHLYNGMYFANYDTECHKEYDDILSLQWSKIPDSDHFDWSDWFTLNMIMITPSKLDDTSRLLMKFINKKKIATLRANYKPDVVDNYFIKSKYDNKLRITHCIKLIGMQLYLLTVIFTKNIQGYTTTVNELRNNNEYYLKQNDTFPYHEYCLQSYLLPNVAKNKPNHCFKHWMENKNICKSLVDIKPPFYNEDNKLNVMEMTDTKSEMEQTNSDDSGNINNFGRCKQFVSSSEMYRVSAQLLPNALGKIGKELTAKEVSQKTHDNDIQCSTKHQNVSLFDMFMQ